MSRARFTTARSVFETFPELASKSAVAATDDPPIVFLKNLSVGGRFEDAVGFCAHLLPRREAVWWGCGSVRAVLGDVTPYGVAGLMAAEAWVHEPTDKNRQAGTANRHPGRQRRSPDLARTRRRMVGRDAQHGPECAGAGAALSDGAGRPHRDPAWRRSPRAGGTRRNACKPASLKASSWRSRETVSAAPRRARTVAIRPGIRHRMRGR